MVGEICLVVDRLALCKDAGPSMVDSEYWQLLPEELVNRILLFVPASSQARLRCVSKRWNQLFLSRAFREESNLIAFRRGHHSFLSCRLEIDDGNNGRGGASHKVDLPGATRPLPTFDTNGANLRVFAGAGLVGVAHMIEDGSLVSWLVNLANKTSCQLPPLPISRDRLTMPGWEFCEWQIWLEPAPESSNSGSSISSTFQVFLMVVHNSHAGDASSSELYTYSSTSSTAGWRVVHRASHPMASWSACVPTKGGFLGWCQEIGHSQSPWRTARMSWDSGCITHLSEPASAVHLIADPSTAAVFGYQVDEGNPPSLTLYRLDDSSSTPGWTCLYSGLPQLPHTAIGVTKVTFLANMLIIVICSYNPTPIWHGLAYHMQEGSCQWFCPPAASRTQHTSVYLEPMLVSQVRL